MFICALFMAFYSVRSHLLCPIEGIEQAHAYLRSLHGVLLGKISHLLCPIEGIEQAHVYLRSLHGFLLGKISHLLCPIEGIEQAHVYLRSLHCFLLSKISLSLPNRRNIGSTCFICAVFMAFYSVRSHLLCPIEGI